MQKRGVFHQISKHVTVHDLPCLWLLNYYTCNEFEKYAFGLVSKVKSRGLPAGMGGAATGLTVPGPWTWKGGS